MEKYLQILDRIDIGYAPIDWNWLPTFFKYENVVWGESKVDEHGLFWLGIRISVYLNLRPY